jgi:hypothetical protein
MGGLGKISGAVFYPLAPHRSEFPPNVARLEISVGVLNPISEVEKASFCG